MGKLDGQYYPDIDLDEAVSYAKTVYDFPNHSMSLQLFADKHQLKIRGGWTGMILASLKKYGLIEGRGSLRATNLAERIINPRNEQEANSAKNEAFNKIVLWSEIRSAYGEKALPGDFWAYLADKYSVDRVKAKAKAEKIAKLYTKSVAFCFPPQEEGRRETVVKDASSDLKGSFNVGTGSASRFELGTLVVNAKEQGFEFSKTLPFTKEGLDILKKIIEFLETQIQSKEEKINS